MDDEDKHVLGREIAGELEDSAYGIGTPADRKRTALLVVDRIQHALYMHGWMPPRTYGRISDWASRTGNIPEHHVNRDVLTSHLAELADILHDR